MQLKKILTIASTLFISYIFGFIESIILISSDTFWYVHLEQPMGILPIGTLWLIGFLVHTLLGIAIYKALEKQLEGGLLNYGYSQILFLFFMLLLTFHTVWVYVFFSLESLAVALGVLLILWIISVVTLIKYFSLQTFSGFSLIPYLCWVTYLFYLNNQILILN